MALSFVALGGQVQNTGETYAGDFTSHFSVILKLISEPLNCILSLRINV